MDKANPKGAQLSRWFHLGYQWDCTLDPCPDYLGAPAEAGHGDCMENPNRKLLITAAARRHAKRTGHKVIVERQSRFTIENRATRTAFNDLHPDQEPSNA